MALQERSSFLKKLVGDTVGETTSTTCTQKLSKTFAPNICVTEWLPSVTAETLEGEEEAIASSVCNGAKQNLCLVGEK